MLVIVIPAKNECVSIGPLVDTLLWYAADKVVVVDDGSTDDTGALALKYGAEVIRNDTSRGIAFSLRRGWVEALRHNPTRIVQMDAGSSHQVTDVYKFVDDKYDVTIGSRFMTGGAYIGGKRRHLSRLATMMCNLAQDGSHFTDWSSGFRSFSPRAVEALLTKEYISKMHGFQLEALAYTANFGLTVNEVPITYVAGNSTFNWKTAAEAFLAWEQIVHHAHPRRHI